MLRGELFNNAGPEASEWPSRARGIHLVPGIVKYEAVKNPDGSEKSPAITYLLTQEAIDRGRPTASGRPIVGRSGGYDHIPGIKAQDAVDGKFDGDIWESKSEDGKEWLYFLLKDPETKKACEGGFKLSCAYFPTEVDETPGKFAGVDYDAVIKDLRYTHAAIVPNPRYDFSLTGAEGNEGNIELLNSIKGGGLLNESLKKVLVGLVGVKMLREITNAAEMDEKATAKEKAKSAFDEEMKNAADDDSKKKALEKYNAAVAAADLPGAADKATKDAADHAERQNRSKMLRNAADAVDAVYPGKGAEHRNEADRLEKIPLGGGDVAPDPGVAPNPGTGATADATGPLVTDEAAKKVLEAKNADDADKLAKEKEEKEKAEKMENSNAAEAWNSFAPEMVDDATAVKVALIGGRIAPFASQIPEVQNAWKAVVKTAPGATLAERCNSLSTKAKNVVVKREADAAVEKVKQERFNSLREAAARRGGVTTISSLGMHSDQDAADLGAALYG